MLTTNSFTSAQVAQLTTRLRAWAAAHPHPDQAVMAFSGGRELSPSQVASAVADRSEDGQRVLRMLAQGLDHVGFEEILAGFPV